MQKNGYNNNQNFSNKTRYINKTQDSNSGNKWEHKEKDAKITFLHESSHFVPAKFGETSFRQFDVAMQLRKEELKKQVKVDAKVSKDDIINVFGETKDHMLEAAKILGMKDTPKNQDILQPDYQRITDL